MEIEGVVCKRCGGVEVKVIDMVDAFGRQKRKAECGYCGSYIQFLPIVEDSNEFVMPFGKHKGLALKDIEDSYLLWIFNNLNLRPGLKRHVEVVLEERNLI